MRIAYVYTTLSTMGGTDRVLVTKANYFAEHCGYEVYIITDSQAGRPDVFPLSPKVKRIDLGLDFSEQYRHGLLGRTWVYFTLMPQYKRKLKETLTDLKPDIVLTALGREMDFLTSLHDGSLKVGESHVAKHFARNFHLMEARGFPYKQVAHYWRKKQERAVSKLDALVLLTEHDAESWAPIIQSTVIPNPVTIDTPLGKSDCTSKRIISVGRYEEQKGYDMLIPAWALVSRHHPDWQLDLYGEGTLVDALNRQIQEAGVSETMHLHAPVKNIADKYTESSFYVMSSRFEGFGLVLVEAMQCGLPCVSFNCPHGPSDIIRNGEDGLLVENGSVTELAKAIEFMIDHEEIRQEMGRKALINSMRYAPDRVMKLWTDLFERLLTEKKRRR